MKTAVITGASGLVGSALIKQLIDRPEFDRIVSLVRKPGNSISEKVTEIVIDFDKLPEITEEFTADCAFCCLGTTLKTAGSKERQYAIDHDYVVNFALACKSRGVPVFAVVSSIGASARSANFYLRTKGEMERDCSLLNFRKTIIMRPSILIGQRPQFRLGEKIGIIAIRIFAFLSFGTLNKYAGIRVERIAERMILEALSEAHAGVCIVESDEIFMGEPGS
jgi:uncharacterized protein YbjT (DUF2867 family)